MFVKNGTLSKFLNLVPLFFTYVFFDFPSFISFPSLAFPLLLPLLTITFLSYPFPFLSTSRQGPRYNPRRVFFKKSQTPLGEFQTQKLPIECTVSFHTSEYYVVSAEKFLNGLN